MVDIPDLPFDNIHKFLAAVGFVLIIPALFIEPVYLNSRDILYVGMMGLVFGLIGWIIESVLIPYLNYIEENGTSMQIRRVVNPGSKFLLAARVVLPLLFLLTLLLVFL
ncbi:hypothetical protein SAMN05216388_101316 [Halorientalis persicus]|uniref:Uncharacterized protein n=1 Tax=Halorientalis persicus TaxID=1367881 RepID=A0A1H8PZS2_9EURY|nr:hypothetical protein [Halorientalis persicus]SEO47489.1 hypothetical protein SAMN05216388_101316 [Halorientalis persicus]